MLKIRRELLRACSAFVVVLAVGVPTVQADYYLIRNINLDTFFGPLGNNPFTVASDGSHAYVAGYSAAAEARDIGIIRINLADPAFDNLPLEPGGTQSVNQFRYYGGLVLRDGICYALTDRPEGSSASTNVRAIYSEDADIGLLVPTFDGDFGDGDGIVAEPAGLGLATGGLAYDPGFEELDNGLSMLAFGSGRRHLIDLLEGFTWYDSSDGMIVSNPDFGDQTAWRDHVYDPDGNVYARRSNQVQKSIRNGGNSIESSIPLTDELERDTGLPRPDPGDGLPVALQLEPFVIGQHIALVPATSSGTATDILIFNDRHDTFSGGDRSFADTIKIIKTDGQLPDPPVQLLSGDGSPLSTATDVPDGVGLYDFYHDQTLDVLLILDFANRNLLVFSGTQPCNSPVQDADGNGNVDLADYVEFEACLNGPAVAWSGPPADQAYCACVDVDADRDVDLDDFAAFSAAFTGP